MASQNRGSYSAVLKNIKKEHAIVFPITVDAPNESYVEALLPHVRPEQIIFAFRMSNQRLCIYFDNNKSVDSFLRSPGYITLNSTKISARRLVNPAKKLLLSNVCPAIPHEPIIEHLINKIGLKLCSPMVYVGAGYNNPALKHVLSSKRSVYYNLSENENIEIPSSFQITHDNEEYRIFINTEENITCFLCKKTGHIAKKCTSIPEPIIIRDPQNEDENLPVHSIPANQAVKRIATSSLSTISEVEQTSAPSHAELMNNEETKTLFEDNDSSDIQKRSKNETPDKMKRKSPKKKKPNPSDTNKELKLAPEEVQQITHTLNDIRSTQYCDCTFTDTEFLEFLKNLRTANNKIEYAKSLMANTSDLVKIIEEIKPKMRPGTKTTLTTFTKSIQEERENSSDSDM